MKIEKLCINGRSIALVAPDDGELLITDAESALALAMAAKYAADTNRIAVPKEAIAEGFFVLSSGIAGEILQKYVNYRIKLAIYGDFSRYTSKPLHDFMYESNKGTEVFFVATEGEALERLAPAR